MTITAVLLAFALCVAIGWGVWNYFLVKNALGEQKRVANAHQEELIALFEAQVTDAVRALLSQAGNYFELIDLGVRSYAVVRSNARTNRMHVVRFVFKPDLSVVVLVAWSEDNGSQTPYSVNEISFLYEAIISQTIHHTNFEFPRVNIRQPTDGDLVKLTLIHKK